MSRINFIILTFTFFNYSCQIKKTYPIRNEVSDSVLKNFISMVDTMPQHNKSNIEFKLLKAYSENDTNKLKKLLENFKNEHTKLEWEINLDTCLKQQVFNEIMALEKYRFNYTAAFCSYTTTATIIKYKDSIIINSIVYQFTCNNAPCKIIEQNKVIIDSTKWEKFQESLLVADFWGLRPDNGRFGFDGSTLEVYGFKEGSKSALNSDKSSFITRWAPDNSSIFNCFILLLKYSKTKKGCIRVF